MLPIIIKFLGGTALRKWLTGSVVALVVTSLGAFGWNSYKNSLREEGAEKAIQTCNEQIYKNNQEILLKQIEKEKQRARDLELRNKVLRAENESAIRRRAEAEDQVTQLLRDREQQAKDDETYRKWSGTAAPDGVFDRLRELQQDSSASPDSN